ncbi:ATP-binding cassette domain-containing protein [Alphaproteobacteria bacterium GH1-50]|uniref:ATP-binding cassette domain-containing protein n=1 Tax=Kangsaoukella pontilimi TaxID=2691042 RepID=A0A7C9MXU5_9RHOB|nr:ATP-binding cassette domain-containing protein [Kangsaoukella pontilimi]MXQ09340.1 ATP-binding cassette domain-containing protein [Kangsaoukella pontilimi]
MIELEDVSVSYGDRPVFGDVSLNLPQGSFHFLTGPSGAGKTTLLRLCYLARRPDRGRVSLFGEPAAALDRDGVSALRRRVGVVHQDCQFVDHLSVAENVLLPVMVSGGDVAAAEADMKDLLSWVGLDHAAERLPTELSGGERQRAALARAVILSPDVILADEPTGNVDWEMSLRIIGLLVELNKLGKTILCATHDLSLIRQVKSRTSARVLRLRSGALELAGSDL